MLALWTINPDTFLVDFLSAEAPLIVALAAGVSVGLLSGRFLDAAADRLTRLHRRK